ncbi:MAG: PilC/PilY family type IV pilus protein, partial [Rhodanobacteraceae bacterium]
MSIKRQTILASRPAAMVLALTLVAGLTAPFLMLPHARAAATPLACAENNNNGCTELSPTPPQDTVAVPPNIMLMLDDSGSMQWNFMPDICYLDGVTCNGSGNVTAKNNDALIDASNNGLYYDPTVTYTPPPQADGTAYTSYTDMTNVPVDAFGVTTTAQVNLYTYNGNYDTQQCGGGVCANSVLQYNVSYAGTSQTDTYTKITQAQCDTDYASTTNANKETWSKTSGSGSSAKGTCKISYYTVLPTNYFQYSTGPVGTYTVYYVASAAQGCGTQPNCVVDSDTSGAAAPAGVPVGENIANWFAYYHTRIQMAKSGLMTAFNNLNPIYRFGFGSIDGNNDSAITGLGKDNYVKQNGFYMAVVAPFGAATIPDPSNPTGPQIPDTGSQRYNFWNWIANEKANNGTPLQTALQAVGNYYETSQPWSTMQGDPGWTSGSTTQFACRSSYTIMTTDGFWNGGSPGVGNVDGKDGPTYTPPAGKTYTVTGYVAAAPYSDSNSNTLADVAMYYWENDLQSGIANEVAPSTDDPAFWQHMTTFTMGLGFSPENINGTDASGNPVTVPEIFAWAQGGAAITGFSWPTPSSNNINNIADLAHAAVNGHGDFFSVKSPQDLAAGFAKAISDINARNSQPAAAAVNASVLSVGALTFETSYNTGDWSGTLDALALNVDGSIGAIGSGWPTEAGILLNTAYHSSTLYSGRTVYTVAYSPTATTPLNAFQFDAANSGSLDATETAGLKAPALTGGNDTLAHRIDYLLGDSTYEGAGYRTRSSLLGAIINSEPVYVGTASGNYYDSWPTIGSVAPPEAATGAQTYDAFVTQESTRAGMVYVGANDGMLHAFDAPTPTTCAS